MKTHSVVEESGKKTPSDIELSNYESEEKLQYTDKKSYSILSRILRGICRLFSFHHSFTYFLCIVFIVASFFLKDATFVIVDRKKMATIVTYHKLCIFISISLFIYALLSTVLFYFSLFFLRAPNANNNIFFCINEIPSHIAIAFIFISYVGYLTVKSTDFYVKNRGEIELYVRDLCNLFLLTDILLAITKLIVKSVSLSFNYSNYMQRIKACIIGEYFIRLLSSTRAYMSGRGSNVWNKAFPWKLVGFPTSKRDDERVSKQMVETLINDDLNMDLDVARKRVIFKEFQKVLIGGKGFNADPQRKSEEFKKYVVARTNRVMMCVDSNMGLEYYSGMIGYFHSEDVFIKVMKILGLSTREKVDRMSIELIVDRTYREKFYLKQSLEQMNAAIERVGYSVNVIIIILSAIMLYIKAAGGVDTTTGVASTVIGASIFFTSSVKNAVNNIIFLFGIHPFDIGDRVFIDIGHGPENMVVSELNVFSTVFYRWDGACIYIPNSVLSSKAISNVRRSGPMSESHRIQIYYKTPPEVLLIMRNEIEAFLRYNSEHFTEFCMLNFEMVEDTNKLHLRVLVQYKTNWQNYSMYLTRKSIFLEFLNDLIQYLKIEYRPPVQRVLINKRVDDAVSDDGSKEEVDWFNEEETKKYEKYKFDVDRIGLM
ncbi:Mechanosensitive ion channel protein 4 [Astathelohania contejeani]|uniref:Mechanosensitive ion channel protein 4 n=1 Tax=Astathelohania contejeani TaxID=164912 RepID=A0ABQ7I0E5_9MICR|nr:Mechanosensitive ion channel protein 4 [Thelohania contejeani]